MSKSNKKSRKNKGKVPLVSEKLCSEPINPNMSNEKCKRFEEEFSDMSKNKANTVTSSEMSNTNTGKLDTLKVNPKPPPANPDEFSHSKNNFNAMKSNLNAIEKKYEKEKADKEKLLAEKEVLESKLSAMQTELEAVKMEIVMLKNERDRPGLPPDNQEQTPMEVELTESGVCEQPVQNQSDETTWEKKHNLVQDNARDAKHDRGLDRRSDRDNYGNLGQEQWTDWAEDTEATDQGTGHGAGLARGSDQDNDANVSNLRQEQWTNWAKDTEAADQGTGHGAGLTQDSSQDRGANWDHLGQKKLIESPSLGVLAEAAGCSEYNETQTGRQTFRHRAPVQASGSDTTGEFRRGSDAGWKYNERTHPQAHYGNEGHRNHHDGRANRHQHNNYVAPHLRLRGDKGDRGNHHQNWNPNMNNRKRYGPTMKSSDKPSVVTEIAGDLFDAPQDCALAHCVAEDMRMGSGIAVTFRQKFKCVEELLDQRKRQGQVAVLHHEGRYIYYLVTKPESTGKPTKGTLGRSLLAMREHVIANDVKKIAMPRIGCGLDRLKWHEVRPLVEEIFSETDVQITIYNYNEDVVELPKSKPISNIWLKNAFHPVADIAANTAILCLSAAYGSPDSTFRLLDQKFRIIAEYEKMDRKLGSILPISRRNYSIIILIVKERETSQLSFKVLGDSMRKACKVIDKEKYYYVALEAFDDVDDPLLFQKVVTVVKSCLDTKSEKELWLCWPKTVSMKDNTRSSNET